VTLPHLSRDDVKSILRGLVLPFSLAAFLLGGCSEEKPTALVASAKDYLAKKDNRAAVIQLKSALQKQPDLGEARYLLGRTLLEDGDAVSGEVELRKALDLKYPKDAVVPALARALVQQGNGQRAIKEYGGTDLAQPAAVAELKTAIANAYLQQGDTAKAQAALDSALRALPDFAPALLAQARLKAAAQDADSALALLDRIIAKDATSYEALQLRGDLLFLAKGDATAALQSQRLALAARPDWVPAHTSILEILLARRDLPAAKIQFDQMRKVLPKHPQTHYFEARLAFQNQDYKAARELVQQLLAAGPNNFNVLVLAGATELRGGSLTQAETYAAKALHQSPNSDAARRLLAQVQVQSGQARNAKETLQPLVERPNVDAETLNLAAQAALQLGDAAGAEAYFGRAAKVAPNDPLSRTALALVQLSKGHSDLAFEQLQEIASSDTSTIADMAIISARLSQRDYGAALTAVDQLERKQPGKPFAAHLRGQIQLARNDAVAARQSFENALSIDPLYFPAAAGLAALDLRDKKPDEARKRFDKLLAADPKDIRALLAIAELRAEAGASKEELAGLLANAIKLNPTLPTPRLMLVDLHLRNKDNRSALIAAQEGIVAIPDSHELLDALGRAQLASGDAIQAVGTFNKLAVMEPHAPQPRMRLAEAYLATNNLAGARENLNRAIEIAPMFLPAQRALIQLELNTRRPEQALAVARKVQADRPSQAAGYLLAGDIESSRMKWDAAAAAYRAGLKVEPTTELAVKLHSTLALAKKEAEADSFAAGWVKEHPQDAAFRVYLGDRAISRLDFTRAEAEYLAVLKLQPDSAIALNNLAWITNRLKKPGAMAYAEQANALQPGEPAFMDTLATVLADSGQAGKALEIEKKVIALQPDKPQYRLNLAKIYIKAGDKANARIELERLAKLGDKFSGQAEVGELIKTL
jgi:cellulose synthase operon protein C